MTRIAVLFCGGIGLAVVARAAGFYRSVDGLSLALVLLIGVGFTVGIVELYQRSALAVRLQAELARRAPSTPEELEACSTELSTLLRRRMAGAQGHPQALFATYLVGLLVMIGMLGTFLGLFESLRGAREALTTSGDVGALRAALASPLQGLWRAFGSSAAGVSTSAALGLALVFARRAEAALASEVAARAAGPLWAWSPAGRQTAALESVAKNGTDLGSTAAALQDAARQLEALRRELVASQEQGASRMTEAVRATAAEIRTDLREGVERAAAATEKAVEPMVERLASRAGEVANSHLQRWTERLEQESRAREQGQKAHFEQVSRAVAEAAKAASAEVRPGVQALERRISEGIDRVTVRMQEMSEESSRRSDDSHAEAHARLESMAQETSRRLEAVAAESAGRLGTIAEESSKRLESVAEVSAQRLARIEDGHGAIVESLDRRLAEVLDKAAASDRTRNEALAEQLRELVGSLQQRLDALAVSEQQRAAALGEKLELTVRAVAEAARSTADGDAGRLASLREVAEQMQGDLSRTALLQREHVDAVTRAVATVADTLQIAESRSAERLSTHVERLVTSMASQVEQLEKSYAERSENARLGAERVDALAAAHIERLEALHATHLDVLGKGLAAPLQGVIESAEEAPRAAAELVRTAKESIDQQRELEAAREVRAEELLKRLAETADVVARTSAQQAERLDALVSATASASTTLIDGVSKRNEEAEQRSDARLGELLEAMQAMIDKQAERLAAFEERLEAQRSDSARELTERVSEHARLLGENLSQTAVVVREASDLVRAGGAEMTSVAEMFTSAVDQYRGASDRLLDGLGPIEVAIERMGQRDTADLLGAYLDQTREVFDSSLRFQRELFAELRALRGTTADA